jgi:hypothetical protein
MEKVVVIVRTAHLDERWCRRIRGAVADELLSLNLPGLAVNVRDELVRDTLMQLTTLDPPVAAVVSLWTQQSYGQEVQAALALLQAEADSAAAYLVTESTPMPPPDTFGQRTPGLANVALLRRPAALDQSTWLHRWQIDHTPVAIETQATRGYTQNVVVRALTANAPVIDGIVEELFPDGAVSDPHVWYGARDDADLQRRLARMLDSVAAFGADQHIDTVPTSRYLFRSPFNTLGSDDEV